MTRCEGTPDWSKVPALQINELHHTPEVDIRAQAQVCYDDSVFWMRSARTAVWNSSSPLSPATSGILTSR